jgi:ketosteroid isomerase-like protein
MHKECRMTHLSRMIIVFSLTFGSPCFAAPAEDAAPIMAADRAFAAMAKAKGTAAAFEAYAADGAVSFGSAFEPTIGPAAIAASVGNGPLEWSPVDAHIAASGDLGYSWGRFKATQPGKDGAAPTPLYGKYVTIWRKQANGAWKFVLDTGAPNAPPPAGVNPLP